MEGLRPEPSPGFLSVLSLLPVLSLLCALLSLRSVVSAEPVLKRMDDCRRAGSPGLPVVENEGRCGFAAPVHRSPNAGSLSLPAFGDVCGLFSLTSAGSGERVLRKGEDGRNGEDVRKGEDGIADIGVVEVQEMFEGDSMFFAGHRSRTSKPILQYAVVMGSPVLTRRYVLGLAGTRPFRRGQSGTMDKVWSRS